jgi:folylpolyglutamate synthase/dihydropteroate synthase
MLTPLLPHVRRIVLTTPPSPRALDPHDLATLLPTRPGGGRGWGRGTGAGDWQRGGAGGGSAHEGAEHGPPAPTPGEPIVAPDPAQALGEALASASDSDVPLVVCGSIFLVGEIRRRLRERFGVPPPAAYISGS